MARVSKEKCHTRSQIPGNKKQKMKWERRKLQRKKSGKKKKPSLSQRSKMLSLVRSHDLFKTDS